MIQISLPFLMDMHLVNLLNEELMQSDRVPECASFLTLSLDWNRFMLQWLPFGKDLPQAGGRVILNESLGRSPFDHHSGIQGFVTKLLFDHIHVTFQNFLLNNWSAEL